MTTAVRHDRHATGMMTWHEAHERAHLLAEPLPVERISLAAAAGRTLAAPLVAAAAVPGFDNAAMDGYAVRGGGPWRLIGRVLAGQPGLASLGEGQAVEIATGAPLPVGVERVVRYEDADLVDEQVCAPETGRTHIRRAGECVRVGQEVLAAGSVLRAAALGLAASVGIDTVAVRRRARVRILLTGDEVVSSGVPAYGQVRDAIGPTMAALLPAWGAQVENLRFVRDSRIGLSQEIGAALSTVDVVMVGGSSSVGRADHLRGFLHDIGARLDIDGVACRPGHPQLLARLGGTWVVGLPGNPFAALVAACTIAHPLLAGLAGQSQPVRRRAQLAGQLPRDDQHTQLLPIRWHDARAELIDGARPGYLGPAAEADALAIVAPRCGADGLVEILPLPAA